MHMGKGVFDNTGVFYRSVTTQHKAKKGSKT